MTRQIPRHSHLEICQKDNCQLPVKVCKKILSDGQPCGKKGHPEIYKSGESHIVKVINHVHFLPLYLQDVGRNDFHNNGRIKAPESIKKKTWKVDQERLRKYPDEVRSELAW